MVSSAGWSLGWQSCFIMENMEVITSRLADDHDFVCLLIMQGLLFTCFLLSQFCLSLISASKDSSASYRISVVDPSSSWRPLRDQRRMSRDTRSHAQQQYTRTYKLQNQCSHRFIQILANKVNANGLLSSDSTDLRFRSFGSGHVTIEAVRYPDNYLCFNRKGRLVIAQFGYKRRRCKFIEDLTPDHHSMFRSVANPKWRIGFKRKQGKPLKGYDTKRKDDCFKFQKIGNTLYSEGTSAAIERGRNSPPHFQDGFHRIVRQQNNNKKDSALGGTMVASTRTLVVGTQAVGGSEGRRRARQRARSRRRRQRNQQRDNT